MIYQKLRQRFVSILKDNNIRFKKATNNITKLPFIAVSIEDHKEDIIFMFVSNSIHTYIKSYIRQESYLNEIDIKEINGNYFVRTAIYTPQKVREYIQSNAKVFFQLINCEGNL